MLDCPELVTVTVCVALVVPMGVAPKVNCAGAIPSTAGINPVPLKLAAAGVTPLVVLEAVTNPARPPVTVGAKLTTAVQLPPPASVPVQLEDPIAKSPAAVPDIVMTNPVSATPPGLLTVTVCPALVVPTAVPAKVSAVGFKLSEAGVTPVPETPTVTAGTPRLVLETVTTPLWLPPTAGVKTTGTPQVAPAARRAPQLPEPTLKGATL